VKYRVAAMFTHVHNATSVVVLLSSTLNPFIYGLWGKQFRAGLKAAACCCFGHEPGNTMTVGLGNEGLYTAKKDWPFPNNTEVTTM
jgi:hypothetical protein